MPINHETLARCAFCLKVFTVYWDRREIYSTSTPVKKIGEGLWLCEEHRLAPRKVRQLIKAVHGGETISGAIGDMSLHAEA